MARIVYTDPSNREHSIRLGPDQPVVSVGRANDCTIRSNRKSVSRHHAEFRYTNGTYEVIDLNSSNGTWLIENEQRFEISHERLEDHDEIWCGDFVIHFMLEDPSEEEATINRPHPAEEQQPQYVPGPTEAGEALSFGAEPSEAFQQDVGQADAVQPSNGIYEYEEVEELGAADMVEVDPHPTGEPAPGIERLRAEKQSIEDLASRQAIEIEELQAKLEQAQSQGGQLEALSAELEGERRQVGELRDELQRLEDELAGARHRLETVREHESQLEREVAGRDQRVEALEQQVRTLESELNRASDSGSQVAKLGEQLDETRMELDKSNRLLGEYERRNADLKSELDDKNEAVREHEEQLTELIESRERLEQKVGELEAAVEPTREELEDKSARLEEAEAERADLRAEVQGLKQRLEHARRRADEDGGQQTEEQLEGLQAELVDATERIAELEAELAEANDDLEETSEQTAQAAGGGLEAAALAEIRQRLGALERLTDAIERTDLEPLSTVDRIRLQSAIRETDPKTTLQQALDLLED